LCETEDEVLQQVQQHAREVHGVQEIPESVLQSVRRSIVSVE
jgi:predicted small metal-binding protein